MAKQLKNDVTMQNVLSPSLSGTINCLILTKRGVIYFRNYYPAKRVRKT